MFQLIIAVVVIYYSYKAVFWITEFVFGSTKGHPKKAAQRAWDKEWDLGWERAWSNYQKHKDLEKFEQEKAYLYETLDKQFPDRFRKS